MMAALLPLIYLALLGVGLLAALGMAVLAIFWPAVEWRLLCWLQRRRTRRESRFQPKARLAKRGAR